MTWLAETVVAAAVAGLLGLVDLLRHRRQVAQLIDEAARSLRGAR